MDQSENSRKRQMKSNRGGVNKYVVINNDQ